jgi:hypothetical protein
LAMLGNNPNHLAAEDGKSATDRCRNGNPNCVDVTAHRKGGKNG